MKVHRLEAHDRLQYLIKDQSEAVSQGASDCLRLNSLSLLLQDKCHYIYIFGHARTGDDGVTKVLYWQPRLSRPKADPNSFLFRAISHSDLLEVCWILPPSETWKQFKKENVVHSSDVEWSIYQFFNNRDALEAPHPDDLPEEKQQLIMRQIIAEHLANKMKAA